MLSELPWQRNDVITFLTCFVFLGTMRFFFSTNRLRGLVPPLASSFMATFERFFSERFGNILKKVLRLRKTVNNYAIDIIG